MPRKRDILAALKREELQAAADRFDVIVLDRRKRDDLVAALAASRKAAPASLLDDLSRDRLKEICRDLGLDDSGREKAAIVARILGEDRDARSPQPPVPVSAPAPVAAPTVSSPPPRTAVAGGGSLSRAAGEGRGGGPPTRTQPVRSETNMEQAQLNWITGFIWNIADDVLRDLYVRGKYRDVILPMTVLRRLDTLLEGTKEAVIERKAMLDKAGIVNQELSLRQAAGQAFYNISGFTLKDLRSRKSQQQLRQDFEAWLDGFSSNVQEILDNFEFRNQIPRLSKADALGTLIEKFLSPDINLSPRPVLHGDGSAKHPGLDNHAMGTIFEELVRKFNEENNEEAGEHWTPRDVVKLMARLIFLPIADAIESGTYLLYDGACGTGGMLTVAEETLKDLAAEHGKQVSTHLYGQEINAETFAICKADLLLKGEGEAADDIVGGPEHSTLANDAFPSREFDFMLSNPPYGKSWKSDLERMGGKTGIKDPRFLIEHAGDPEYSLLTRSSDGQMLFLANLLSKMKHKTALGSRIAEVHNGSSLFTGDAGQGESNIRRWIVENDWLEAIVALPLNLFYNTGIATYVWVLTNRKPAHRRGKVQLIDATSWFKPLRKNLGKKNCELSPEDIQRICDTFLAFEETGQSKIFPNEAFGYWKVTVERPLRLRGIDPERAYTPKEVKALKEEHERDESAPPERSLQTSSYDNWKVTLPGDLVLNRFKAHLGVFFAATLRGIVSFHYGVFAPRRNLMPEYFELLYHLNAYKTIYAGRSNGMTVGLQNLSNQNFYCVRSIFPPVEEQAEIVAAVEAATKGLNHAARTVQREIELLHEFRARLIADVVTGKLDVREAAARLPEEAETELLDEREEVGEGGEDLDDLPEEAVA